MAKEADLNHSQVRAIDALVEFFTNDPLLRAKIDAFDEGLKTLIRTTPNLFRIIHSFRSRTKEPSHLREKIIRKFDAYSSGGRLSLTRETLGLSINDLVGVRILHLHTHQIVEINAALTAALFDFNYAVREGPVARTWDDELREYYHNNNIGTIDSKSMYTSVHYVVNFNNEKQDLTAEIQVRTLAEELWGEVEHNLNYPEDHPSAECREQIKVLARLTSGATRLVDSIYLTDRLWREQRSSGVAAEPAAGESASMKAAAAVVAKSEVKKKALPPSAALKKKKPPSKPGRKRKGASRGRA